MLARLASEHATVWAPAIGAEEDKGSEIAECDFTFAGQSLRLIVRRQPAKPGSTDPADVRRVTIRGMGPPTWENVVANAAFRPRSECTFQMRLSRRLGSTVVDFETSGWWPTRRWVALAWLAERLGFKELLDDSIDLGGVAGHAN